MFITQIFKIGYVVVEPLLIAINKFKYRKRPSLTVDINRIIDALQYDIMTDLD